MYATLRTKRKYVWKKKLRYNISSIFVHFLVNNSLINILLYNNMSVELYLIIYSC